MGDMDDIVREFLIESSEGLDQLDRNLVALEQKPGDKALLAGIFRCIHTIKGTSGFLGFGRLESVTHVGESLLSDLRDGKKLLTPEITSALLQLVDAVRRMLTAIERSGADGEEDFAGLIQVLTRLQQGEGENGGAGAPTAAQTAMGNYKTGEAVPAETQDVKGPAASDSNIRVDVGLLDKLMNLVGELVLARNQILQHTSSAEDPGLIATSQRLNLITTELQEGVMKTRMQPIGNVWSKFPRVVRDLSLTCRKQVRVEMEGKETELDRTIIEAIKDPLTHIVRNSVDHGLELPDARNAAGKPAEGRLLLRAYHEGGQVNIEISDDGQGIDTERVKQKALQRGLLSAEQVARLGERELVNLVFAPGFSTADQVSNISGRGVGMDVVKTNIEKIGGTVDLHSEPGQGTTVRIKIPLTLAIIPALLVTTAGDRYAIPQVSLLELVRIAGEEARARIEMVYGAPVYRLRDRLLPLVNLRQGLDFQREFWSEADSEALNIVVLQADDRVFGLVVDQINDTEEIVVKPLGAQLKGIDVFAGATILGDGRVALILDVPGLAHRTGVISEKRGGGALESGAARPSARGHEVLLLFQLGTDHRMAIPLSMVARLEEFPQARVERLGQQQVIQYRGRPLPLLHLSGLLGEGGAEPTDPLQVVVYTHGGRDVGLVVENIVDVVEESLVVHRRRRAGAVFGTAVIQERVTDLLDVGALIEAADVELFQVEEPAGAGA